MLGGNHRTEWATTYPFPALPGLWPEAVGLDGSHVSRGDTVIGHDVWLGSQALILSGVTIGHGAVVAARAVVAKDVPPYAIVAGNPARVVRYRMSEERIAALLRSQWWLLPEAEVRRLIPTLLSERIEDLPGAAS
ncbi:MAG: CatB-related O-acetyltransferase [Bosea sp.]|nr:CatB-related O-acetyltransferase [Bosea sp. (in: a-proteobacteria)]